MMSSMSKVLEELYMHGILVAFIQSDVFLCIRASGCTICFGKAYGEN